MKKIIIAIIVAILLISCASYKPHYSYFDDPDVRRKIDTYNENHKDEWNGYKGTRRNSIGEDDTLRRDGYDPESYRRAHGY